MATERDHKFQEEKERVSKQARETFAEHQLIPETTECFLCGVSGQSRYHFRVIVAPGAVFMLGDLGTQTWLCHERDSLAWLLGSVGDLPYLMEKCAHPDLDFYVKDALADLQEREEEADSDQAKEIWHVLGKEFRKGLRYSEGKEAWESAWIHVKQNGDVPSFEKPSSQELLRWKALQTFARLYYNHHP